MIVPPEKKDGSGRNIQDSTSLRRGWKRQTRKEGVPGRRRKKQRRKLVMIFRLLNPVRGQGLRRDRAKGLSATIRPSALESVTKGTGDSSMGGRLDAVGMV